MRTLLAFALIVVSLLTVQPLSAQGNSCVEQVYRGATLQFSEDGVSFSPVPPIGVAVLRNVYACPITAPVTLGALQPLIILVDQNVMVAYASPNGQAVYVHRQWKIYALTMTQWRDITSAVTVKAANRMTNKK